MYDLVVEPDGSQMLLLHTTIEIQQLLRMCGSRLFQNSHAVPNSGKSLVYMFPERVLARTKGLDAFEHLLHGISPPTRARTHSRRLPRLLLLHLRLRHLLLLLLLLEQLLLLQHLLAVALLPICPCPRLTIGCLLRNCSIIST